MNFIVCESKLLRKPKIFVDGRVFDTEYQGTRTYVENIYKRIDDLDDFNIFIASESPSRTRQFFPNSRNITFLKYKEKSKLKRILFEIPKIISEHKIDISHFQYIVPPLKNCIQVVTIHDILFKDFPEEFNFKYRLGKGALFYYSAKRADVVTTVSEYSRKSISQHFKVSEKEIQVIPNGVSSSYFETYDRCISKQLILQEYGVEDYLLYVSRIEPRKNQLALLKAYLELQLYKQNKALVFIGKTSIQVPQMDAVLSSLDERIRRKIHFFEDISNENLKLFYQAADVFLYPSKAEGFGIPPLEAGALRIPTVCSNTTAMADFSFFGDKHINPDVSSIKNAIERALACSESILDDISCVIKERYSWESSALKLNELIYNKLKSKV